MKYSTYLFDADDTLFDFAASEKSAFAAAVSSLGFKDPIDELFAHYKIANAELWLAVEQGQITKEFMRGERFRRAFEAHKLDLDHERAGHAYLEQLPEALVLIDHAKELLENLSSRATVGIITNGFESVQTRRLAKSGLGAHVKFMVVSEAAGFAKPDIRFFEHTMKHLPNVKKENILVIGDRLETDVLGAHTFGVDVAWFNPSGKELPAGHKAPTYTIRHLSELVKI